MMRRFGRVVSALRTPMHPPGPTRLKPLIPHDQTPPMADVPDASGAVDAPGDWVALAEAKRLGLQPDDVVVIRLGKATTYLSAKAMEQIRDEAKVMFPDNRVCLFTLDGDVSADASAQTVAALRQVDALEEFTKLAREGFEAFATPVTATPEMLDAIGKAATVGCARQAAPRRHAGRAEEIHARLKALDAWYRGVPLSDRAREEWNRLNVELAALNAKAQQPERVFVLAASAEHARSFGQDWADAKPSRDPRDCVDLLDHLPGSPIHRMPVSPVIRLARSDERRGFDVWLAVLRSRGIEVRCAEEVAACAL
jgi:hypothetical protein